MSAKKKPKKKTASEEVAMKPVEIRSSAERLRLVRVGDMLRADEGEIMSRHKVLSNFVIGENGEFLDPEAALALLDDMTIGQHEEVWFDFLKAMNSTTGTDPK